MTDGSPEVGIEAFRADRVGADPVAEVAGMIFMLDLQEHDGGVQRLRDWVLGVLDPRTGEVAVDVGAGTGTQVRRLAELVGAQGRAVGVEPNAGLRAEAVARAAGTTAEFVDGDAVALPFDDASVDVLVCERVFQHLPDSDAAAREIARVLRPGGRACVTDSDWETAVDDIGDPDVARRLAEFLRSRVPNPTAGRRLRGQLRRAGLVVDPDIGSTAVLFPRQAMLAPATLRSMMAGAVAAGVVTQEEADRRVSDIVDAAQRDDAFRAVTMFAVVARRSQ